MKLEVPHEEFHVTPSAIYVTNILTHTLQSSVISSHIDYTVLSVTHTHTKCTVILITCT